MSAQIQFRIYYSRWANIEIKNTIYTKHLRTSINLVIWMNYTNQKK